VNEDVAITEERVGGRAIITVKGEIDVASAPALRNQLRSVCVEGVGSVVLDLRQVTFLDSSALGVLVGALRRCREVDSQFQLVINSPRLLKIFEITGLTSVFDITGTLD
jgi:anti-sigma B factor antagonist